ncbi:hypothetical protein AB1Y20_013042 [Prymnesium parvum]|uniref:Uncharacterized protein n=1 Tax=Prymnesium parvum TaxID=97485 RepID=A0AB34IK44_PRYPA
MEREHASQKRVLVSLHRALLLALRSEPLLIARELLTALVGLPFSVHLYRRRVRASVRCQAAARRFLDLRRARKLRAPSARSTPAGSLTADDAVSLGRRKSSLPTPPRALCWLLLALVLSLPLVRRTCSAAASMVSWHDWVPVRTTNASYSMFSLVHHGAMRSQD